MRILILIEDKPENQPVLLVGARLAQNLYAHVNLLAVDSAQSECLPGDSQTNLLVSARQIFIDHCEEDSPFSPPVLTEEAVKVKPGLYDLRPVIRTGPKELKLHLRFGEPAGQIIDEAYEEDADLIILSAPDPDSKVAQNNDFPLKVAAEAPCSTLIIKEAAQVENIIIGVENPDLGQSAREMFNQIATVFKAPAAMYPLPALPSESGNLSAAMNKLVKIFQAHDLNIISAESPAVERTVSELYKKAGHNLLVLR